MNLNEEYSTLIEIARKTGDPIKSDEAHVIVHANNILASKDVPGLVIDAEETEYGIRATFTVKAGFVLKKPVHLCFGHLGKEGKQVIESKIVLEDGAKAKFYSHCIFPNAIEFLHAMEGDIVVGKGADMTYEEVHVHGPKGKIEVRPVTRVIVNEKGRYVSNFALIEGRVGILSLDVDVDVIGRLGSAEITSKIYGKYDDQCSVKDVIRLSGENSSGLAKARVVLKDHSFGKFYGEVQGAAEGAKGHVDCTEVVQGYAKAEAVPVVSVIHPGAEITHEAAIGKIANEKLWGLMAKGLSENEAIDVIVSGLLR